MAMTQYEENLDRMFAIWNTTDEVKQAAFAKDALEHNVHFVDSNHNIIGGDAFLKMVRTTKQQAPKASFTRARTIGFQNNFCRYHWAIHNDGTLFMTGFDVVEVNDAGKIVKVIGFFGELEREEIIPLS
jgi:hypothetical protein